MLTAWIDFSQMAGNVGQILIILGIIALAVIIYKFFSFIYLGVIPMPFTKNRPLALFNQFRDIKEKDIKIVRCEFYIAGLQSGFNFLNIIVTIAPLLGLLGTVIGMIEAFQSMASLGDAVNIASLASGIWKALVTTATGLIVAIPVVVCLQILQNIVEKHTTTLNKAVFGNK